MPKPPRRPLSPLPSTFPAIPETPAELLEQWEATRKPSVQATILASFVALWNVVAGPGMTDQARLEREIAETRGYRDGFTKLV